MIHTQAEEKNEESEMNKKANQSFFTKPILGIRDCYLPLFTLRCKRIDAIID